MNAHIEEFRAAIYSVGLTPPELIEPDGKLHRFASSGKTGDSAGAYVLYLDGVPAGWVGDWRTGVSKKWRAEHGRRLTAREQAAHRAKWQEIKRVRDAELLSQRMHAAKRAARIWETAASASAEHPYLLAKGVKSHGLRVHDDALVVPMRDASGLQSLQFITNGGDKKFLPAGRVRGCYFPIGEPDGVLCIAEGYATGASIHEATGYAVAVAFNAGNLPAVARSLRQRFPDLHLLLCADDDAATEGNPGLSKARDAAQAVGGVLVVPEFGANRLAAATDFNDVQRYLGLDALREQIRIAVTAASVLGARLLSDVRTFIARFCALPSEHHLTALTLWAAHCHVAEHLTSTPRLAILSPEPGSGKSRVLEVLALLVPEPMFSFSASPAAIFRSLATRKLTLLVDEVDAIFSRRGADDSNEDLRALLNAGYRRGATVPRCVGPRHDVQEFPVFAPAALAGLGDLPDTLMSRSIIFRMRRRRPDEVIEPFRTRVHEPAGHALRDRFRLWAAGIGGQVGGAWPELPNGVCDRPAELWEPLLAVADAAGGEWPELARAACGDLCRAAEDRQQSLGVRLLQDLRTVFGGADVLTTQEVLERLSDGEGNGLAADAPWSEIRGKPLGVRGLATMLNRYGVKPTKVKVDGRALQGYRREHLWDAWARYLPALTSKEVEPPEPVGTPPAEVPRVPEVPDTTGWV